MDRSFLSAAAVVAASRSFVCVRLTTYENKDEADLLKSIFIGGSGDVENTTFAILSPDGKKQLVRGHRSPRHRFTDADAMAESMNRIARQHEVRKVEGEPELPKMANLRLALDVAACDNQPLAVLCARDGDRLRELQGRVRKLAWSADWIGRFVYVVVPRRDQLGAIESGSAGDGLLVIQPDRYGLKGKVLARAADDASTADLARALRDGAAAHQRVEKNFRMHVRDGQRQGVFWETAIPITDPMERRAREQGRRGAPPP